MPTTPNSWAPVPDLAESPILAASLLPAARMGDDNSLLSL
jgi:hypothetical protein